MRTALLVSLLPALMAADRNIIGLTATGSPLEAVSTAGAGPTVIVIGGREAAKGFHAVPNPNPDHARLVFPPTGTAYRDNPESHYLWRWILTTAPDLVVVLGKDDAGLADALRAQRIPVRRSLPRSGEKIPPSEAHKEMERRLARSPREVAMQLAEVYGHEFPEAVYIPGMALLGRLRLGERADVERIVAPFTSGAKDSLAKPTGSHLAGHLVFAELGNTALVRRAADLAAQELPALHNEMSDAVFMGTPILTAAGYYDKALQHLRFMQKLCLRPDGFYRHSPLNDAAWGRGNAFPALGLALALSNMPPDHPAFRPMLESFRQHMAVLAKFQTEEGMWRQVIDMPGVYQEFSATAMIGTAMLRGIRKGWLDAKAYRPGVDRAWRAILKRTGSDGRLIDVCEGTGKQKTAGDYLRRAAIMDRDQRGGGMALYFATEMLLK